MRRIVLILIVALGLSPGLFWRSPAPRFDTSNSLALEPLTLPRGEAARIGGPGGPRVTGAWRLRSANSRFGSYSALVAPGDGTLLAISDRGQYLRFPVPGHAGRAEFGPALRGGRFKKDKDIESATRDPASGTIWIGMEGRNAIARLDAHLGNPSFVQPAQMHHWRTNGGPEALLRLADGRFLVLAEDPVGWADRSSPGLLFAHDPLEGGAAEEFRFAPPAGMSPTDLAQLPDGRVLILLRGVRLGLPPFTARLVIADPAEIRRGEVWRWQMVGALRSPIPIDNMEGLALTGGKNGAPLTLWIISDDNGGNLIERSVLLRLEWQVPPRR